MKRFVVTCALGLWVAGCADSSHVPTFSSGVAPERPLLGQSPSEQRAFCEEAMRYTDELYPLALAERAECLPGAFLLGLIRGVPACEAELMRCEATQPEVHTTDLMCEIHDFSPYAGCQATVGEVEACASATAEVVTRLVWPLSCSYIFELISRAEPAAEIESAIEGLRRGPCAPLGPTCPYFGVALDELAAFVRNR
ncbi:MAG: hypothetical protein R3B40_03180 [Polyangiales bacterium]